MDKEQVLSAILTTPRKLFPKQEEAVLSDKRFVRIVAGAGAGKTETLTRRIAYLLLFKGEPPESIVAFTFTERAAQSMKNRVYQRVAELQGEQACARLGEMYIGTIHAYCLRLLQDYFGYGNHEALDENQEMAFLMRHGWGLGLHTIGGAYSENCNNFLKTVNLVYDELLPRGVLETKAPEFYHRFERYESLLQTHKLLTFAQMIVAAVEGLSRDRHAIERINHLIVDEYQDINKAQESLIRLIAEKTTLFAVGDPRQCIYRWRGSDESYFERFIQNHKSAYPVTIPENNRSCSEIVKTANSVADSFKPAKYEHLKEVRSDKGVVIQVECDTNRSEASWVIDQVDRLVTNDKLCDYSDIAILLRSVSTSAEPFIEACKDKGIPYLVGGKVGLFRRDEAQIAGRLYAWLSDDGFWWLNAYTRESVDGEDLLRTAALLYSRLPGLGNFPEKALREWRQQVRMGQFKHFTETYQALLVTLGFRSLDPENKLHSAMMANLGRFNALLTDYESAIRRGGDTVNWSGVWKGLTWYMNSYAVGAYEEQPAEDLRGVDALQIMTVHQAKGLEWPMVFVPCVTGKRFPSSGSRRGSAWHIPESIFDHTRYAGGLEDERKLFYVAITRARDICCISYHTRIRNNIGKSPFLKVLGKGVVFKSEKDYLPKVDIKTPPEQEEIQTYSGAEIIEYRRCPYFYRLRQQWNYQAGLDPDLGYGKSLHHCLRVASNNIKAGDNPKAAITQAVDTEFHLPYAGSEIRQIRQRKARETLSNFVEARDEDMRNIEEVEARLEFPVEKATITGRVDVILRGKDKPVLEVRDYKTSEEVTTFKESSTQVRLYTLGLQNMGRPVEKASIAYLDTGVIRSVDVTPKLLQQAKKDAEEAIRNITACKHKVAGRSNCKCDYVAICRYATKK
jgi:DNA helicase-2/ATP-dependent DNA helicase PcrA